jgi:hypothetical protein
VTVVEVRCPVGPRKLFTRIKLGEEQYAYVPERNLIEFSCGDCSRRMSRERGEPLRVYHRFNFIGDLMETVVLPRVG